MGIGILHLADVHFGSVSGGLPSGVTATLHRERLQALQTALHGARKRRAAAVVVAGDLLEGRLALREHAAALARCFGEAGMPVVVVPGNHDPAGEDSYYRRYPWPDNVHVMADERWTAFQFGELVIHGFGWQLGFPAELPSFSDGLAHVLLLHADLDSASPYRPLSSGAIVRAGAAYVALGHIHARRQLTGPGGRVLAAYPGSLTPLGFGEEGQHGALWVEVEPGRIGAGTVEFLPLARRQFRTVEVDWRGQAVGPWPDDLVRIRLTGATPDGEVDAIALSQSGYHVEIQDRTSPVLDLEALIAENPAGLLARFVAVMRDRMQAAAAPSQAAAAGTDDPDPEPAPAPPAGAEIAAAALRFGVQALTGRALR